jgi:DNA-binding GntR family transcriptional regulator
VTDWLREAILRGQLAPGQHLLEEELADKLDVSRGPVRDALLQLEHEGLVIVRRHRGAFVARLSPETAEEVHSLRLALERLAVERSTQKAKEPDWLPLEQLLGTMRQVPDRDLSVHQLAELDLSFHDLIFHAAHHERLLGFWSNLRSQVYILLLWSIRTRPDYVHELADAHSLILDALRTRNAKLAVRIIEDHLLRGLDDITNWSPPATPSEAEGVLAADRPLVSADHNLNTQL